MCEFGSWMAGGDSLMWEIDHSIAPGGCQQCQLIFLSQHPLFYFCSAGSLPCFQMCLVSGFSPQPWLLSHLSFQHQLSLFRNHSSFPGFWKHAHNKNPSRSYFSIPKKYYFFPVCSLNHLFFIWNSIFQLGSDYISWGYNANHISF